MDKGFPPLVSRAEVDVTIEDTVNSAPIINLNTMFGGAVSEMAQSGKLNIYVKAFLKIFHMCAFRAKYLTAQTNCLSNNESV